MNPSSKQCGPGEIDRAISCSTGVQELECFHVLSHHCFSLRIHTCGPRMQLSVVYEPLYSCREGDVLWVGAEEFSSSCFGKKKMKNRELENMSVYSSKWVSQKMCSCEMSNKHTASLDLIISQSHTCYWHQWHPDARSLLFPVESQSHLLYFLHVQYFMPLLAWLPLLLFWSG